MIVTALTEMFGLQHPIVLGPMGSVSGGHLAAAVSNAGGLGLVGGGYGDPAWLRTELSRVKAETSRPWGVGLITWSIDRSVLDLALSYRPDAFLLSFGDPRPYAPAIKSAGCKLICQVQDVEQARVARDAGADLIVAEGTEAGGHSGARATLPLVPAVVDAVTPIPAVAAGGIADGRGLAASLMLGAHGALSRRRETRLRARTCSTSCAATRGPRPIPGAHFATASWSAGTAARAICPRHWKPNVPRIRRPPAKAITLRRSCGLARPST